MKVVKKNHITTTKKSCPLFIEGVYPFLSWISDRHSFFFSPTPAFSKTRTKKRVKGGKTRCYRV